MMYHISCSICDILTKVSVVYESDDDIPRFCPMCGSDVDVDEVEEDDIEWDE